MMSNWQLSEPEREMGNAIGERLSFIAGQLPGSLANPLEVRVHVHPADWPAMTMKGPGVCWTMWGARVVWDQPEPGTWSVEILGP